MFRRELVSLFRHAMVALAQLKLKIRRKKKDVDVRGRCIERHSSSKIRGSLDHPPRSPGHSYHIWCAALNSIPSGELFVTKSRQKDC